MNSADAALVARYPELPGLATMLDAEVLARVCGAWGTGYVVERLRLKPGASVTAVLRPPPRSAPDEPSLPWLLARALAPELWETKREKDVDAAHRAWRAVGTAAQQWAASPQAADARIRAITAPRGPALVVEHRRRVLVTPAIGDRRLRGLSALLPDTGIPVRLRAVVRHSDSRGPAARDPEAARRRGTVRTLSHNPARRFVGHWSPLSCDSGGGDDSVACDGSDAGWIVRIHAGQAREVVAFTPGRPWVPGDAQPDVVSLAHERARADAAVGWPWKPVDVASALRSAAVGVAAFDVAGLHWQERAARIAAELGPRLETCGAAPAHGDYSADQLVVSEVLNEQGEQREQGASQTQVLDWDRCGLWPLGWDAATWQVTETLAGRDGHSPATLAAPPEVVAAAALLRAPEPFRRRHFDWAERTEELVALAERHLGLTAPKHGADG